MNKRLFGSTLIAALLAAGCNNDQVMKESVPEKYEKGTFGYDMAFLKEHDSLIVLQADGGKAKVVVSPKYQAKVFTSTADGDKGQSFGWIHYKAFTGPTDAHMNAYGGENRIWLGPEGGKYSLFFPKGAAMEFANWKTPAAYDTEAWKVTKRDSTSVSLQKDMQLENYAGTPLSLSVVRDVVIMSRGEIDGMLQSQDTGLKVVGYRTDNVLTNTGKEAWTEKTGMPCIWMLDMFRPSAGAVIVIPHKGGGATAKGAAGGERAVTTDYFGEIPPDRIRMVENGLFFKADGKSRGKLGIGPTKAMPWAGSYDTQNKVLTVTIFDVNAAGRYLNQEWNTLKPVFSGDAVNAYNDGALADGSQMGPFYELESVSPAALLEPSGSLSHEHTVLHFTGTEAVLEPIVKKVFGVSLSYMGNIF